MRENVTALTLADGTVPELVRKPRQRAQRPAPLLDVQQVPRDAVAIALQLARGDSSRLTFLSDGTVLVSNAPRPAHRTRETHQ
jgi:hypothetical protein